MSGTRAADSSTTPAGRLRDKLIEFCQSLIQARLGRVREFKVEQSAIVSIAALNTHRAGPAKATPDASAMPLQLSGLYPLSFIPAKSTQGECLCRKKIQWKHVSTE